MTESPAESSHWHYNGQNRVLVFSQSSLNGSFSNLQVTRTVIKSQMSSKLGRVRPFTMELFALERSHGFWMGKMVSPSFLGYYEFSLHQLYRSEGLGRIRISVLSDLSFWSYMPLSGEKNDVSSFSQSLLIGSLSNLQVTGTGIKDRTRLNLGRIRLFTLELLPSSVEFVFHRFIMEKMMSPLFLSYYEFNLHQTYR